MTGKARAVEGAPSPACALEHVLTDLPIWEGEVDGPLVCEQVQQVTHDVRTFVFRSPSGRRFRHLPGQYVTVSLEIGGTTVSRCYTITSPPTRPHTLSITVKRVPGGIVSNHLHDGLRPGVSLEVDGPFGTFSMARHPSEKYLFVSAGSGVTPLMAMTRTVHDLALATDVVFVHFARTPADIVFRAELDAIASRNAHVRLLHVVEEGGTEESWSGLRGRVSRELLAATIPDVSEREAFVCGPGPFMTAAREALLAQGLPAECYHEETFVFEDLSLELSRLDASPGSPEQPAAGYEVTFRKSGRTVRCRPDQFVLDAALESGLTLPSSCGQGMCGTCKTTLLEGTVDMTHQGGIRQREIDNGKILICCSRPTGPLVIDS